MHCAPNKYLLYFTNHKYIFNVCFAHTQKHTHTILPFAHPSIHVDYGWSSAISFVSAVLCLARGSMDAALKLHSGMLYRVLRCPMQYFETTPTGQILARFSSDLNTCDNQLPMNLKQFLNVLFRVCCDAYFLCVCVSFTMRIPLVEFHLKKKQFFRRNSNSYIISLDCS